MKQEDKLKEYRQTVLAKINEKTKIKEQKKLEKKEQRLREKQIKKEQQEQKRLDQINEKIRLKEEKQRLKEEKGAELEQRLKEEEKINLKEVRKLDDEQKKKRLDGMVKWFNGAKGYGFIKREDKEKDIFVHFSAVKNSGLKYLKKDEQLTFEVEYSDKGPAAVNLQKTVNEVSRSHLKVVK